MGVSSEKKAIAAIVPESAPSAYAKWDGSTDDLVNMLSQDRDALVQLVQEHRILKEAIESAPPPFCVYTPDDRLLATNAAYENMHPALPRMRNALPPGHRVLYADIVREQIRDTVPAELLEIEVQRRVLSQRFATGDAVERNYGDRGTYRVVKYRLASGGTAGLAFDVSELKKREADLLKAKVAAEEANDQARIALETERTRKVQMRNLSQLGEWLQSCQSLTELFQVVECFMARIFEGSSGELYIYSNLRDILDGRCEWNRGGAIQAHIHPDDCWALRRGRMTRFGRDEIGLTCTHVVDLPEKWNGQEYICIPIIAHGETIGLLHIRFSKETSLDATLFEETIMPFAVRCAEQISLAIANVKLHNELMDQSTKDALTGLWNRRHLMNQCRHALAEAERYTHPVSVIALDVDNFKTFNDVHGHDAGDSVLRHIGKVMQSIVQDGEIAARLGGEEFLLLLPQSSIEDARIRAEMLREKTESLIVDYGEAALPRVTISAGIATAQAGQKTNPQDLIRASDRALYAAKNSGRNRVMTTAELEQTAKG